MRQEIKKKRGEDQPGGVLESTEQGGRGPRWDKPCRQRHRGEARRQRTNDARRPPAPLGAAQLAGSAGSDGWGGRGRGVAATPRRAE